MIVTKKFSDEELVMVVVTLGIAAGFLRLPESIWADLVNKTFDELLCGANRINAGDDDFSDLCDEARDTIRIFKDESGYAWPH